MESENSRLQTKNQASSGAEYDAQGTLVLLRTSMGNITLQMRKDKPITVQRFVNLVDDGFYNGTVFHRVIAGFMIQGGNNPNLRVDPIPDEIGQNNRNVPGSIAMAKTSQPNSATSQFFINVADNGNNIIDHIGTRFDAVFTVFGRVVDGMETVLKISRTTVARNLYGENSQPIQPITLVEAVVLKSIN